ncbi:MAG: hypothetical protein J5789_02500 [Oscillospiraceae bacterium]|nr:hypothetical protein [Oscillospiraceae bacterium]
MLIKIGQFEITECWDGVFYKAISSYPEITEWEMQNVLDFIRYEEGNGRSCRIEAEDSILRAIQAYREKECRRISPPARITECTACPAYRGCMTDYVCHTSSVENAVNILDCGSLLSPVRVRKMSGEELRRESRNAAKDPADYFDYVMFAWGNCQAGDRLVMERKLGRFPNERDLSVDFTPGVRFFFRYDRLIRHPQATFDGVLPLKVKNEVVLKDWAAAIIAPDTSRTILEDHIPEELKPIVHFLPNDCSDIWDWSQKVYEFAKSL